MQPGSGREPETSWGKPMESLTGRLLVATPALRDPNFERTVVLLVAHEDGGALAGEPAVVFEGGPVQPEAAICLARTRPGVEGLAGFNRVSGAVGTVDLSGDPDTLRAGVVGVRVFAGYAGWEPGQLEAEIETGSWFVFDALPGDAFAQRPDDLWGMVLRRQGGLTAAVAHFPADPTLN